MLNMIYRFITVANRISLYNYLVFRLKFIISLTINRRNKHLPYHHCYGAMIVYDECAGGCTSYD